MKRRVLIAIAAVAVVVVGVAAWTFWPRGTSEVSEEQALDDFRDRTSEGAAPAEAASSTSALPAPGVYTYAASGEEKVKLGPLPTETRPFPEQVTATVVVEDDDCFVLTVNLFQEHTEDTRYCTVDGELVLDGHTKHQQIGALSPTAEMRCDPAVLIASRDQDDEQDLACTLELSGGPAAISATLTGTAASGGTEELEVDGETVEATPLTIAYEVSGDLSGAWTETLWLTEAHLPVRIERTLELNGPATFSEQSRLDLERLTPAT